MDCDEAGKNQKLPELRKEDGLMAGDGVMEFGDWVIEMALLEKTCVKVSDFPDELTCLKMDELDVRPEWCVYVPKGHKCSECKERKGYYLDAETIQCQQERIAELEERVSELKVENAKLWRMNEIIGEELANFGEQRDEAVDERDALIRDLWSGFVCGVAKVCDACPSGTQCGAAPCAIEERMRKLGIEVDE